MGPVVGYISRSLQGQFPGVFHLLRGFFVSFDSGCYDFVFGESCVICLDHRDQISSSSVCMSSLASSSSLSWMTLPHLKFSPLVAGHSFAISPSCNVAPQLRISVGVALSLVWCRLARFPVLFRAVRRVLLGATACFRIQYLLHSTCCCLRSESSDDPRYLRASEIPRSLVLFVLLVSATCLTSARRVVCGSCTVIISSITSSFTQRRTA